MKYILSLVLVSVLLFIGGCKPAEKTSNTETMAEEETGVELIDSGIEKSPESSTINSTDSNLSSSELCQCWTDSREEYDYNSPHKIFRPCDYKAFPPSRFRFIMELNADSTCRYLYLAPNDRHTMKDCKWTYNPSSNEIYLTEADKKFRILEISKDKLILKK